MESLFVARAILILFLCCNFACQSKPEGKKANIAEIDVGSVAGGVYTNEALGFRLKFPETMIVDSREELDAGLKEGIDFLKQGNGNYDRTIDTMRLEERIVFGLSTPDSEAPGNLNITVKRGAGEGELKDMTTRTLRVILDSTKAKVVEPVSDEIIGGVNFASFVTSVEIEGVQVYTKLYGMRRNGHLVSVSISYSEDRGFRLMESVLNGIEFF